MLTSGAIRQQRRRAARLCGPVLVLAMAACTAHTGTASVSLPTGGAPRSVPTPSAAAQTDGSPLSAAGSTGPSARCTSAGVNDLVERFILAFNAGDQGVLQRLFTRGDGWDWYATDGPELRFNKVADDREGLGAYFMRRHAHHEAMHLKSFKFNGINGTFGEFQFALTRRANDMPQTESVGKGSVACATSPTTIGTWSMARDPATQSTSQTPAVPSELGSPPAPPVSRAFHPTGLQVVEVAHLRSLIRAYNAGDLRADILAVL